LITRISSHLFGETIAESNFRSQWSELLDVLGTLDAPLRDLEPFTSSGRPPSPKRQYRTIGGKRRLAMFPISQAQLNARIDEALRNLNWSRQPVARGDLVPGPLPTNLLGDFEKTGVFVEVEFGNMASAFRDLFKFQIASRSGAGQLGVLVVAADRVARFFDQGVATFEQVTRLLPYMGIGLQLPTVVVGLNLNESGWHPVRERYDQMRDLCDANGLDCHPFEAVYGAPEQISFDGI
jgi:hypothetical protein